MTRSYVPKSHAGVLAYTLTAMVLCVPPMAMATTYTVAEGETFVLDSGSTTNAAGNRIDITGSATLKLTGSAPDGAFPLKLGIRFTNDTAAVTLAVDVSELSGCTSIRMTGDTRDISQGGLFSIPSGIGEFVIGTNRRGSGSALDFTSFDMDVSFADAGGKVVLTNDVSATRMPTCSYAISDGARLATFSAEILGEGDYTLANFDVEICDYGTFTQGSTITVPSDRKLYIRPAKYKNVYDGAWSGTGSNYATNNVVLGGEGAEVSYQNNNDIYGFLGTMSGTGDIYFRGNGDVTLKGALDYTGKLVLSVDRAQTYTLCPTNGSTIVPEITAGDAAKRNLVVHPDGWDRGATSVRLNAVSFGNTASKLHIAENQTMTVGTLSGLVMAVADGAGASLIVENLAENAVLYLQSGVALTVKSIGAGAQIALREDSSGNRDWSLSGPDTGAALMPSLAYPDEMSGSSIVLGGLQIYEEAIHVPTLTILPGASITAQIDDGSKIINKGGTITQTITTWRDKVTLWTDASDTSTFTDAAYSLTNEVGIAQDNAFLPGAGAVAEWRDCRPDHQGEGALRFRNYAFDSGTVPSKNVHKSAFPFAGKVDGLDAMRTVLRYGRMQITRGRGSSNGTTINIKYAIFVMSGKYGGGNAFFTTKNGVMKRVSNVSTVPTAEQVSNPLVLDNENNRFAFRTNGVDVASSVPLTGDWQIMSFASDTSVEVVGFGHASTANVADYNGGQCFAEIMLFGEMPTEEEREAAETYLAKKWNLPLGHEDVVQRQDVNIELSGSGTVSLASDAAVTNGMFSGTVNLNGHRLQLSADLLPYNEATLPSENRILWVDPSLAGSIDYSEDASRPDEVAYLYSRDNAGVIKGDSGYYLTSPYVANGVDRRVRVVSGSRANGPVLPWLVYMQKYEGDTDGNHLIIRSLPAAPMTTHTEAGAELPVKAGFFALDTTDGGGTIIAHRVNGTSGDFTCRTSLKGDPIFRVNCSDKVKAADGWLDEVHISPSNTTYNWRPEVFAFNLQPEDDAAYAKVIGYYGQGNAEVIGEFLLYSTTQPESVRRGISAYLMKKWLGKQHEGFSDFRDMTVSGDGVLAAEGPEYLPELTAEFTGSLEFSRTAWTFTLPKDGGDAALNAVDLSGQTVSIPAEVTVNVDMAGAKAGTYLLMRVGSFSGETEFALGSITGQGNKRVELLVGAAAVSLRVYPVGAQFIVR